MKFRKDINGLRAFAVIAVVLFHFNAAWMPGGFAGVDVFFVISGFLMTGIIFRGIEQDNFSVLNFYVARANRIIPALALLCLALLVFGWFYLTPLEYKALGKHAASSVGFLSNFTYWLEAGYFDAASHEKWLLHTWSLSVEWQFYIIYPLALLALRKFLSIKTLKVLLIVGTVLGFIFSVIATYKTPNAAYYLFPTRAWEMMVGGVAYLYPFTLQENRKKLIEWSGLILVIASYFLISAENLWPGYLAIFPVLGSFLIIQAQRNDSFITGNIVFQKLGAWSYSIYLWHWPFVVAIYTFSLPEYYIYISMILSVFLGFLSYKYVEKINFPRSFSTLLGYFKCIPLYIAIVVFTLGAMIFKENGIENRYDISSTDKLIIEQLAMPTRANGYCFNYSSDSGFVVDIDKGVNCYIGSKNSPVQTLIFGDSYVGHYDPFFDELFKNINVTAQSISTNSCYPSLKEGYATKIRPEAYEQCLINRKYVKENLQKYKNIIIGGRWDEDLEASKFSDIEDFINEAATLDINVFIMAGPYQYQKSPINNVHRQIYLGLPFNSNDIAGDDLMMMEANNRLNAYSEKYDNVYFIDRSMLFEKGHQFTIGETVLPYTSDAGHLSIIGSKNSAKYFMAHSKYEDMMRHFNL